MKADLKVRPQSRRIKLESASNSKRKVNGQIAEDNFKKAKAEQAKDHFEQAIELYTRSVGYNPNYYQAYCNMGYCYRVLGKYNEAKRCYLSSLSINKDDLISHYNLANLERIMGENELAIQQYSYIIDLAERNVSVGNLYINSLINIGICFKNEGQLQEAIQVYRKVVELDPKQQDAKFNLAICLLNSIESKNFKAFNKFYKERATEADQLFRDIFQKNEKNYMAKLCLLKISTILDNSSKNIESILVKLKQIAEIGECDVKNQVKEQIARLLNMLEQYQESSKYYQNSLSRKISVRGKKLQEQSIKIDNLFGQFKQETNILQGETIFTESKGIMMIEEGRYMDLNQQLEKLSDKNYLKHGLRLMLYLKQAQDGQQSQSMKLAIRLYKEYFDKPETELPFSKLSLQTHKAIGKLLNLDCKYEKSIKHYEYISQKLKDDRKCASARLFNELGEGFEETGNYPRALQEYKRAMEIEPDNYGLTYNMAYCLYESGHLKEASDCFSSILEGIKKNDKLNPSTKQLYETDCMIMLALSNQNQEKCYSLFSQAFAKLQKLREHEGSNLQPLEDNLLMFLIEAAQVFEKKLEEIDTTNDSFKQIAEVLLSIYTNLLEIQGCPDPDQIFINSGSIYYQLRRYAAASNAYQQVKNSHLIPQINLALAYAHLIEPILTMKHIKLARIQHPQDLSIKFCNDIFQWVYFNDRVGDWSEYLPAIKWDMFYERNQYGLALVDKLTSSINSISFNKEHLPQLLEKLAKNPSQFKFKQEIRNIKFQKEKTLIEKYDLENISIQSHILNSSILKICFTKSNNIANDFLKLVELLCNIARCGREGELCEAAVHLFIYNNKGENLKVKQCLQNFVKKVKQQHIIRTPRSSQIPNSIYSDFKNTKQFVLTLKEWEATLDATIVPELQMIEEVYYSGKIRKPLEFEYHFPRHHNLLEEDETFQKIIYIVLSIIKYESSITCKGTNVGEMKQDLIKQFQHRFNLYLQKNTPQDISLSTQFLPLTIYSTHLTKQDCLAFINEISRRTLSQGLQVIEGDQIQVIIDNLLRIRCQWNDPYSLLQIVKQAVDNIIDNPMFIVNQSIVYLQKIRTVIASDSDQAKRYIQLDSTLHF